MTLLTGPSDLETGKSLVAANHLLVLALQRLARNMRDTIAGGIQHVEGNMVAVCVCAAIMFPAYWFVWTFLFPQPYENLPLRLIGSLLCLIVAAKDRWPGWARLYLAPLWLGTVLYCGPFFFTFMLLQNDSSTVWLLSTMAGLFLVVLLLDWISLFVLFIAGAVIAWRVHLMLNPDTMAVGVYFQFVPIFLFALIAGAIFSYRAAGLRQAKERARVELGVFFANEMQVPLFSLRTSTASLKKFLPTLVQAYAAGRRHAIPQSSAQHLQALELVPARIDEAVEQMRGVIEILMFEGGQIGAAHVGTSSMLRCLDAAIARLPGAAEIERARILVDRHNDFLIGGAPVLMMHVLARVLDAAWNEIAVNPGAELSVSLGQVGRWNYLRLGDSATELGGSMARLRSRLSRNDRDFSDRPDLALAKLVLERMGGTVTRSLAPGRSDETVLWFAKLGGSAEDDIRSA